MSEEERDKLLEIRKENIKKIYSYPFIRELYLALRKAGYSHNYIVSGVE